MANNEIVAAAKSEVTKLSEVNNNLLSFPDHPRVPTQRVVFVSQTAWECDLFGDGKTLVFPTKVDSLWVRIWTRFFFHSKWTRLIEKYRRSDKQG